MIKKFIKIVRGFSPVELVIMVGFGALAAAALIFLATSPQYMASSQPVDININVEGAASVSRQASAQAAFGDPNPELGYGIITKSDGTTDAVGGATEDEIWVYPTNNSAKDPVNLQWAFDNIKQGGTVLLKQYAKGTTTLTPFLLANTTMLSIARDVNIKGEYTDREVTGQGVLHGTTITGGNGPFNVGAVKDSNGVWQRSGSHTVTIKDIRFLSNIGNAIRVFGSSGYNEISGCSLENQIYGPNLLGISGSWPISMTAHRVTPTSPIFPAETLGGEYKILNNYFGTPATSASWPHSPSYNHIPFHVFKADMALTVDGNYVQEAGWMGFLVSQNKGLTKITNNIIKQNLYFGRANSPYPGFGIVFGAYSQYYTDAYNGSAVIEDNEIFLGPNSYSYGITVANQEPIASAPEPSGITVSVADNTIHMGGEPYVAKEGEPPSKNRPLLGALWCQSGCRNSVWKNNVITGKGSVGINLVDTKVFYGGWPATNGARNNQFTANDLTGFVATQQQVLVDEKANGNIFKNNNYGAVNLVATPPAVPAIAGAVIKGDSNTLTNENFVGNYPGKNGTPRIAAVLFDYKTGTGAYASENNTITALKNGQAVSGSEICTQIIDKNWETTGATTNIIPGAPKCDKMPVADLEAIDEKIEQNLCEMSDGTWEADANNNMYCVCPATMVLGTNGRCECPAGAYLDEDTALCVAG